MRTAVLLTIVLMLAIIPATEARPVPRLSQEIAPEISTAPPLVGGVPGAVGAKAYVDTIYLIGEPGTLTGTFEDAYGQPDWQGWTSRDMTTSEVVHWNVSDYYCANLDPETTSNQAWWCGRFFDDDCGTGDFGGYGPNWSEAITWQGIAPDPNSVTVNVTAVLNHDLEQDYDYLRLVWKGADGTWNIVQEWTGTALGVAVDATFVIPSAEYGQGGEISLAWWVQTDPAYDDDDCEDPSSGAAQIDNIAVSFDEAPQGAVEDCEGPFMWTPQIFPGVGDFAKIWSRLPDINPCHDNFTPQVAFIDDGEVVPGTGGTLGGLYDYGPGGFTTNWSGGLLGGDALLRNHVESPPLEWWQSGWDSAELAFDVYAHLPFEAGTFGTTYYWAVRSTASYDPDSLKGQPWINRSDGFFWVYYSNQPLHLRRTLEFGNLVPPDSKYIQVALGVRELSNSTITEATPAPYFDNVAVKAWNGDGPYLFSSESWQAQDAFPEGGALSSNLADNSVRFDRVENLSTVDVVPGDALLVEVFGRESEYVGTPQMHWALDQNPVFNDFRSSIYGTESSGIVDGEATGNAGEFAFDLPDTSFLFPGDVLHYYFEATENGTTAYLPVDTSGFGDFSHPSAYPTIYTMRALPTCLYGAPWVQPAVLFWNDAGGDSPQEEWYSALDNLGWQVGVDYDVFTTKNPWGGHGNGLGGLSSGMLLAGYKAILYSSGNQGYKTLNDGDSAPEEGDDVGVLRDWLLPGGKNLLVTGNHVASDLASFGSGSDADLFLTELMGVTCAGSDVGLDVLGAASPEVVPGDSLSVDDYSWLAYGGCDPLVTFDDVSVTGSGLRIAEFALNGSPGSWSQSAGTKNWFGTSMVVSLPYDLMQVWAPNKVSAPLSVRSRLLQDVVSKFGLSSRPGSITGVPDLTSSTAISAQGALEVSMWALPGGTGDGPASCFPFNGLRTDATITLQLYDEFWRRVVGYPAEDMWLGGVGLVSCEGGTIADAPSGPDGKATFSRPLRAGGSTESLQVYLSGEPLTGPALPIRVNSSDINGDLVVDLRDVRLFASDIFGVYSYRSDFYWDGGFDLRDFVAMGRRLREDGANCPLTEVAQQLPDSDVTRLGVFFDQNATSYCLDSVAAGSLVSAYLCLIYPPEGTDVSAWECEVQISGNATLTNASPRGLDVNVGTVPSYNVGLGTPLPYAEVMVLMDLTIEVLDPDPVEIFLRPADVPSVNPPLPAYVSGTGELVSVWPMSGDFSTPAAVINGPCPGITYDLVAYWSFDTDFTATEGGAAFDATPVPIDGPAIDPAGRFGGAARFTRDYVTPANSDYLEVTAPVITQGRNHTYSAWYKADVEDITGDSRYFVMESTGIGGANAFAASYGLLDGGGPDFGQVYTQWPEPPSPGYNNQTVWGAAGTDWHNIIVTYDADNAGAEHAVYLDGAFVAAFASAPNLMDTAGLVIGGHRSGTGRNWDGWIDDVAFWSRVLSADEIAMIQTRPIEIPPAPPEWTDATSGPLGDVGDGSSAAWGDYDNDGDLDLYLSNVLSANKLLCNHGDDVFTDVTTDPLGDAGASTYASWGDYDNDGDLDLYQSQWNAPNILLRNDGGGVFTDATSEPLGDPGWSESCAWGDYDNDGDLDLYLANYNQANKLLRNKRGEDVFVDATSDPLGDTQAGIIAAWGDYDNDGDLDIYLGNSGQPNKLFRNDGGGNFSDQTSGPLGFSGTTRGLDWGDYDNDGDLDLYLSNTTANLLLRNDGGGLFADATSDPLGDEGPGRSTAWSDYDNDGDLDLYLANDGQENKLFRNDGGGVFVDATDELLGADINSSVAAWGDYDDDGDLDIYLSTNGTNRLFRNDIVNDNHWLQVKLTGTTSNANGIGARLRVVADGQSQIREVSGNIGNSLPVEFGLGAATVVDTLRILWPSGVVQDALVVAVDQRLVITEPVVSGVEGSSIPAVHKLHQCYPNPFNPMTTIKFDLPVRERVSLRIYDISGRTVRTLIGGDLMDAGQRTAVWKGRDEAGRQVSAGVYFYRLEAGAFSETRRMTLVK